MLSVLVFQNQMCVLKHIASRRGPSHAILGDAGTPICQRRPFADTGIWKHRTGLTRTSELMGLDSAPR